MVFDLKNIEALAPDQSSLSAASKLTKLSKWMRLEQNDNLLWGECQGSGANPYRVIVDSGDHGYKCTCPSRKFPCKHSLALMLVSATAPDKFSAGTPPEWVTDWLGRRRKSGTTPTSSAIPQASGEKSIDSALNQKETEKVEDPKAIARKEAAQKKRAEGTQSAIANGLDELDQWIADQLRLGLGAFIDNASDRCRRIAARMVDQKAAALSSRIDEIPSRLMVLRNEERPEAAIRELGKLVLLAKAWRAQPEDIEIRRYIATSETREQLLDNKDVLIVDSRWEVLGEKIQMRRDGLVSHATWLLNIKSDSPDFALLLDFYPASAGKRSQAFSSGEQFDGKLAFYPSKVPLRALVLERSSHQEDKVWPERHSPVSDPLEPFVATLDHIPWLLECPLLLPAGAIKRDQRGIYWWQANGGNGSEVALPVQGDIPLPVLGIPLSATTALWNGMRLDLLAAQSAFGRLDLS